MQPKSSNTILVIKLSALGDFVQSLGAMKAIKKHHPDDRIILLTTKSFKNFGEECGYFDEIVIDKRPKFYDIVGWLKLRKTLNNLKLDRVYDLQNNDRTNLYFKLCSPKPEWVGTAKGASHRNTSPERTKGHAFHGHVQTLEKAGLTDINIDTLEWMKSDISNLDIPEKFALFVTGCAPQHPEKRWPLEHFKQLGDNLLAQDITPILIGGPSEKELNTTLKSLNENFIDLTGTTSFHDIVSLAHKAKVAVGNDTGPMHLIGASGCQTIAMYNTLKSNPDRHYVLGDNVTILSEAGLENLSVDHILTQIKT